MQRALASTLMLLASLTNVIASETRWPPANPGYVFIPASGCETLNRKPEIYDACADQMALFTKARAEAATAGQTLLVVFGATWCPSCRGLKTALPDSLAAGATPLAPHIRVVEITISTLAAGRIAVVPSGDAVRADLALALPAFRQRAIPFLAAIEPASGRTSARHLDDLASSGRWSQTALAGVAGELTAEVHGGPAAASEPGWLLRKWRRWFGDWAELSGLRPLRWSSAPILSTHGAEFQFRPRLRHGPLSPDVRHDHGRAQGGQEPDA